MWNIHIDKALAEFGLHWLTADFCVYACFDDVDYKGIGVQWREYKVQIGKSQGGK